MHICPCEKQNKELLVMGQTNLFSFVSSMLDCKSFFQQHLLYRKIQLGIIFQSFIEMQPLSARE